MTIKEKIIGCIFFVIFYLWVSAPLLFAQNYTLHVSSNVYSLYSAYPSTHVSCSELSLNQSKISRAHYLKFSSGPSSSVVNGLGLIPSIPGRYSLQVYAKKTRVTKSYVLGQGERCSSVALSGDEYVASIIIDVVDFRFARGAIEHCKTAGNLNLSSLLSNATRFSGVGVSQSGRNWYFNPTSSTANVTVGITATKAFDNGTTSAALQVTVRDQNTLNFVGIPTKVWQKNTVSLDLSKYVNIAGGKFYIDNSPLAGTYYSFPADADQGTHTIKYTHTNSFGCTGQVSKQIKIVRKFVAVGNGGNSKTVCSNERTFELSGNLANYGNGFSAAWVVNGKTISGNKVTIDPSTLSIGLNNLSYSLTHEGYTDVANVQVFVNTPTTFDIVSPTTRVRRNDQGFNLSVSSTGGGSVSWSSNVKGALLSVGTFNPSVVDVSTGPKEVVCVAKVINQNGCVAQKSLTITVVPYYELNITLPKSTYCRNDGKVAFSLSYVPSTGTIDNEVVFGNSVSKKDDKYYFDPAEASLGLNVVTYTIEAYGFTYNKSIEVNVEALPEANAGEDVEICKEASLINLTGFPAGGIWQGVGVSSGQFFPQVAGVGTHKLTYTVTSETTGCAKTDTVAYKVTSDFNLPLPEISGLTTACAGTQTTLVASNPKVSNEGLSFEWYRAGEEQPFATGERVEYTIRRSETLVVKQASAVCGAANSTQVIITSLSQDFTLFVPNKKLQTSESFTLRIRQANGDAFDENEGFEFVFDFGDGTITDRRKTPIAHHIYYEKGEYQPKVKVYAKNGCESEIVGEAVTITSPPNEVVTGVSPQPLQDKNTKVYPNPFKRNQTLIIDLGASSSTTLKGKEVHIAIYNLVELVYLKKVWVNTPKLKIKDERFRQFSVGMYMLRVFDENRIYVNKKILVQ